jgi:hypothetical protein
MPDAKSDHPHWFSREKERVLNAALTAAIIGAGIFVVDYVTTDPEHEETILRVKQHEERLNQGDETIALLTQSVAQQAISVTGLAVDRAVTALSEATKTVVELERDHGRKPLDDWPEADRQLYLAAKAQLASAEIRLGLDPLIVSASP